MKHDGERVIWHRELADTILQISAFQVDHRGELLDRRLRRRNQPAGARPETGTAAAPFPTLLSQTGLFTSTSPYRLNPSLIPYSVNAPGWTDGAAAERFMAVPGDAKVGFSSASPWTFPDGTALVQTLSLERHARDARRGRFASRLACCLRQQGEWAGYSYRWNSEQTDASLVRKNGEDAELELGKPAARATASRWKWRFPSRVRVHGLPQPGRELCAGRDGLATESRS